MAGALRKTMEYLGLAESEERDDYYDDYSDETSERRPSGASPAPVRAPREEDDERRPAEVAQLPTSARTPVSQVVRKTEVGELNRITTIHPRTYNEAKTIGEAFRSGVPVIINLTDMDDADAKRLVDFAAGLAFGLRGSIERVTSKVFLLSPEHVAVDTGSREPARAPQGPFNQS